MREEDGQMILLSAVITCIFLILIVLCLNSVRESAAMPGYASSTEEAENVLWAQDACIRWYAAAATAGYSWDRRYEAANEFRTTTTHALAGMEKNLQRRGIAYSFTFNDSAARPFASGYSPGEVECIGGVLVSRTGAGVKIVGCGYDVRLYDRSANYEATRLVAW
ncbi:DUF7261 family protein [Methanocella arvoryzae]|uniref:Uncharacterized protein n=1 Tax=Methanocella arvoryzae (strain DSM 22066 / NBRC 105507 / MRE50) TaxID=351160 RepID=Q0W6E6_METAR|nr:hypothetical protein [Methanocella arvoryzae]CAJ36047.1 hypothetical protein RCIX646 [Methanocella arvoryzae MRE50]